jgi:hypothetical protein
MKWFLPGKTMLNMHTKVKSIEDILSEQQTNQEADVNHSEANIQ